MTPRGLATHQFAEAAIVVFNQFAQTPESRRCIRQISSALKTPGAERLDPGSRLPACSYLDTALAVETKHASLRRLIARFKIFQLIKSGSQVDEPRLLRKRVRHVLDGQIDTDEVAHGLAVVGDIFKCFIGQCLPLLEEVHP